MENDDIVEAIDELGLERLLRFLEQLVAHRLILVFAQWFHGCKSHRCLTLQCLGADIGRHNDDRVAEIDLSA